jgi:SSS family solute:Na+ symporter
VRFEVTGIDLGVFIAYLILSRIIPLLFRGKNENSEDYFLGGRNFIWPLIGFSLVATNVSGSTFVGLAGGAYTQGISIYAYEWMTTVVLVVFMFFILPFYLRSQVYTMPEFLSRRYDGRSRLAFSGFTVFTNIFIDLAVGLYAGAVVIQAIFPQYSLFVIAVALALLAGVYTSIGGLSSVMVSDTIQCIVILIGGTLVFTLALIAAGGWEQATQAATERQMSLILPANDPDLPWPGLITGAFIIGLYAWTVSQVSVQRTLGAKSLDHGRWGQIFCGFMKLTYLFLFIMPGIFALGLYPDLDNPDLAFPTIMFDILPIGIRGLILAALVAAVTSSIDSIVNAFSTVLTMDFVKNFRPQTSEAALVNIGRISTVGALAVACGIAPLVASFGTLYGFVQSALSYLTPPLVAVFILGIMWPRITATAAFTTLVTVIPLGVVFFIVNEVVLTRALGEAPIQFLYAAGISFAMAVVFLIGISLLQSPPDRESIRDVTWDPSYWREDTEELRGKPLLLNYRFWSVALLISTAIIVFIFR